MGSALGLGAVLVLAGAIFAQAATAQSFNGCPAGQAVQGSDPSGKHIQCIAVPDVSGLQAQIDAEKAARTRTGTVSGTRTFNEDGTGTTQFQTVSVNAPGFFYNVFGSGVTSADAPNRPAGAASVSSSSGSFTWELIGSKLVIREDGAPGVITKGGGNRNGWAVLVEDLPPFVGTL